MHLHRYERIWLIFGISCLVVFLSIVGVNAFAMGNHPPSHTETIDPEKVSETPPFNEPGLKQIGDKEYEAVMVAYIFGYDPGDMKVPVGSKVTFKVTSKDVVHGFAIPGTNVNMMIVPGHINEITTTFDKPGKYLILCNEYCGTGHEIMATTIEVVE